MMRIRLTTRALSLLVLLCSISSVVLADDSNSMLKKKGKICFDNEDGFYVQLYYSDLGDKNFIASGNQTGPDGKVYPVFGSMQVVGDKVLGLLRASYIDQGLIMETVAHYTGDASTLSGEYDVIGYYCFGPTPGEYNCGVTHLGRFAAIPVPCL